MLHLGGLNEQFGTQEKMPWVCKVSLVGQDYIFLLMCIEPKCLLSKIRYHFANVNLEAVASLCAILFSRASDFVHIGSIL